MLKASAIVFFGLVTFSNAGGAAERRTDSVLVGDFLAAAHLYADGQKDLPATPVVKLWLDGMAERGIDPAMLRARFRRSERRTFAAGRIDPFAQYRQITVEDLPTSDSRDTAPPMALHAFRFDVVEDYDDTTNDDIYCYFITTHDDLVWGKVTSIYTGLDEGQSFFFSPEDRGLFGPKGDKLAPRNHTLVDFGIVESDSGDIAQLKKLSDAIVDLALVALTIYDPNAGAAAAQARAETNNLLHLIIEMDDDDRLVADTLRFTPDSMLSQLGADSVSEFDRYYDQETFWTHYSYRLYFRLMR
jgi:hypothetical protein